LLGCFDAERDGQVRLSGADRAGEDDVVRAADPLSSRQLGQLGRVDGAVGGDEVEGVEGLHLGEASLAQAVADRGVATRGLLGREGFVQKLLVAPVLLARLACERLEDADDAGHLERLGLRDDQLLVDGGAAHDRPPSSAS
jgi:hypothetical protein